MTLSESAAGGVFVQVLGDKFFIYKKLNEDQYAFFTINNQEVTNVYQAYFRDSEYLANLNNYLGTSVARFTELPIEKAPPGPWPYPVEVVRP